MGLGLKGVKDRASTVFGLSSFWTGVCLGAPAVGYAIGNYLSARYSAVKGVNWMIRLGATLAFFGLGVAMLLNLMGFASALLFFASLLPPRSFVDEQVQVLGELPPGDLGFLSAPGRGYQETLFNLG